mmetsp:Transcript_58265/g.151396  ORF Transcript_58265/g.151396 Transcript_58265/m.151396 type:complete len:349 (-) Transcript_58265:6-1052(-)
MAPLGACKNEGLLDGPLLLGLALGHRGDGVPLHEPLLRADALYKIARVRDHHHAALEALQGLGQRVQGLHVYVVGRLVEGHHVGLGPEGCAERELRLLARGEAADVLVEHLVLVEAERLQVLQDLLLAQRARVIARRRGRLPLVVGPRHGDDAQVLQLGDRLPRVLLGVVQARPLDLVHHLAALHDAADDGLHLVAVLAPPLGALGAQLRLLLVGGVDQPSLQRLVIALFEALLDVDVRGAVHELGQVIHVLLGDVGKAQIAVPRDLAALGTVGAGRGRELAADEVQQRALACAGGPEQRDVDLTGLRGLLRPPQLVRALSGEFLRQRRGRLRGLAVEHLTDAADDAL